jgi:hypothetical protein
MAVLMSFSERGEGLVRGPVGRKSPTAGSIA